MKSSHFRAILVGIFLVPITLRGDPKIIIQTNSSHELVIAVNPHVHLTYGLSYPVTYQLSLPPGSSGLSAFRRYFSQAPWEPLVEKSAGEFFNAIEAVRFDYANNLAFISVGFGDAGDSIFVRIAENAGEAVDITFDQICRYYDNRDAAVTVTADDWHPDFDPYFTIALDIFRSYHLYVSTAIVTEWCDSATWAHIQGYLDLGDVEACSHGRNHLHSPYTNPEYEVGGAKEDIISNLDLPPHSRYGNHEYVPVWVAPYGEYDAGIEEAVINNKYLVSRLVSWNYMDFSTWSEQIQMYDPIGVVHEMGPLWGGVTDTVVLNNDFDVTVNQGGVYHVMCHPHVLADQWGEQYPWAHLRHISNRPNLWYANLGHLYMYHLLQDPASTPSTEVAVTNEVPRGYTLRQNFPNPFNPTTTIEFSIPASQEVSLRVYDVTGREVGTLVSDNLFAGTYRVTWRPDNLASGMYWYLLRAGEFKASRPMVFVK